MIRHTFVNRSVAGLKQIFYHGMIPIFKNLLVPSITHSKKYIITYESYKSQTFKNILSNTLFGKNIRIWEFFGVLGPFLVTKLSIFKLCVSIFKKRIVNEIIHEEKIALKGQKRKHDNLGINLSFSEFFAKEIKTNSFLSAESLFSFSCQRPSICRNGD